MKVEVVFQEAEAIQLKAAILLYGGSRGIRFASVHEPYRDGSGAPYLDAGRPVTLEFLRNMARGLGLQASAEVLPDNVVARTPELICWWVPARRCSMFFSSTCDGKTLNGKTYPHPPLLFRVEGGRDLSVRALIEDQRPIRTSVLAVAPYWNTAPDGRVCVGSMPMPAQAGLESLAEWEDNFFRSEFTHPNAPKLTAHPEGHLGLWRDLQGARDFPREWLVPAENLERWLCAAR